MAAKYQIMKSCEAQIVQIAINILPEELNFTKRYFESKTNSLSLTVTLFKY